MDLNRFPYTGPLNLFGLHQEVCIPITTDALVIAPFNPNCQRLSGTGAYKLGANYGPCVMPQKNVNSEGYAQNLWLHGPDHCLTEVGTMNMFVVFKRGESKIVVLSKFSSRLTC